jgi:hypothetical protein
LRFWKNKLRQYFQDRAKPIVTKIYCTKARQSADLLSLAAIDMRYVAGDLSSLADDILSPRADIKWLTNRLDNCIVKLLATLRATSSIMAARELAHGTSKSARSFRPSRRACVSEFAQGRNNVAPGESSTGGSHSFNPRVEILFQILEVFEVDGKAQGGTRRIPRRRAALNPVI